jgi:signal transduction histidine kinase
VEDEMAQVWTNLLSNALHAVGDEGDIEVELLAMHDRFQVSVVNNGPPIPADIMARMYDPMFTTKKKGEGTGLGLSIVKGFVESHQGSITCDSSTERTIFVISLPTNPSPIHDERTSAGHTVGGR